MQRPSATSGEEAAKNRGQPLISSLRQSTLPLAASRQESAPRMPSVMTLPSVTVGEALGPEKPEAGPVAPRASYLSFQSSLPEEASRQRVISPPSWREKTKSLSPTSAG